MITFASSRALTLVCFLVLPPLCHAHECKIGTATAPLHAAIGGGHGCSQKLEVKVCAPAGKALKSSSVKDLNASPNIDFKSEVRNAGNGCAEAEVIVRARTVMGPAIWEYCQVGSYDGRVELTYCR